MGSIKHARAVYVCVKHIVLRICRFPHSRIIHSSKSTFLCRRLASDSIERASIAEMRGLIRDIVEKNDRGEEEAEKGLLSCLFGPSVTQDTCFHFHMRWMIEGSVFQQFFKF